MATTKTKRPDPGPCICHSLLDCPVSAHSHAAARILRGDHPNIYKPTVRSAT